MIIMIIVIMITSQTYVNIINSYLCISYIVTYIYIYKNENNTN